ncbi:transglutaminase-like domain-containing protein [Clostridium aestuarii]|uniref:Transglutaminase-like domain-containing protein n=1 Tax=Clostridium aestuarii TaxID=338193 RepID=A0ABT4CV31_9CLOT|nr:transglutaminase-like domain-containing protein [Clostridium aestuarii]MCY6482831.1 transglutaminase-like domain-containing protein [Clostridium aestuarii]
MIKNPVDIGLIVIFFYPLLKGFLFKFSSKDLKDDIEDIGSYIALIIGAIIGIYVTKQIFILRGDAIYDTVYSYIPQEIVFLIESKPIFIYIIIMPIVIFLLYKIIELLIGLINCITLYPLFDSIEKSIKRKNAFIKRILGVLFQIPKAICYILAVVFVLNILVRAGISQVYNQKLEKANVYSFLSSEVINPIFNSKLAKQLPDIINNSFKIVIKDDEIDSLSDSKKTIVYYNGITLEQGLKSNKEIDEYSVNIAKNQISTYEKVKAIYHWIGKNIEYDYDKVNKILNNDFSVKSGAINAFNTRKGICFDYACLYAVMCRANNIKVRIITGEGFNGSNWVNHAWNQVYIEKEDKWINIDVTFYKGGNYFDSSIFKLDHRNARIAR